LEFAKIPLFLGQGGIDFLYRYLYLPTNHLIKITTPEYQFERKTKG